MISASVTAIRSEIEGLVRAEIPLHMGPDVVAAAWNWKPGWRSDGEGRAGEDIWEPPHDAVPSFAIAQRIRLTCVNWKVR